jgi:hypothetical protein
MAWLDPQLVTDEDTSLQWPRCPVCGSEDYANGCIHLVGRGEHTWMDWDGGLTALPGLWEYLEEALEDDYLMAEVFQDEPPWDQIVNDLHPVEFLGEHHPEAKVCSVMWEGGGPGSNGCVNYVYMTRKAQAKAERTIRRLQGLIDDPPASAVAARRSRTGEATDEEPDSISRAADFARIGQFEQAVESLEDVMGEGVLTVDHWYNLACYCAWADRKWDALFALKQAICLESSIRDDPALREDFADLLADSDFQKILRNANCDLPRRHIRLDLPSVAETESAATEERRQGQKEAMQAAEDSWQVELAGMNPDAALSAAIMAWDYEMVSRALDRGAGVNGVGTTLWAKALSAGQGVPRPKFGFAPKWTTTQARWYRNYRRDSDTGVKICRLLFDRGADPNIRDGQGRTLLDHMDGKFREELESRGAVHGLGHEIQNAIDAGDVAGLRILLDGVEAGYQLPDGKSLLSEAIEAGTEICRAVLEAVPGAIGRWEFLDCLGAAVRSQDTALAELFLEHGADPLRYHWHEGCKISRLRLAVDANDTEMVKLLLEFGAEEGSEARRCLLQAREAKLSDVMVVLEEAGVAMAPSVADRSRHDPIDDHLIGAAAAADVSLMTDLLNNGANPDAALPDGATVMMVAVDPYLADYYDRDCNWKKDEPEVFSMVTLLLNRGAALDQATRDLADKRRLQSVLGLLQGRRS